MLRFLAYVITTLLVFKQSKFQESYLKTLQRRMLAWSQYLFIAAAVSEPEANERGSSRSNRQKITL